MKKYLILTGLFFSVYSSSAQSLKEASIAGTLIQGNFGLYLPFGDLANRFGNNSSIGGGVYRKSVSNFIFGIGSDFIYGRTVKESSFIDSLSAGSDLIGYTGTIADVALFERGYMIYGSIGKLVSIKKINPNSGIIFSAGVGFLQHKIRIVDQDEILLQLNKEYKKGYDRLTNGVLFKQTIQLINLDARRRMNFRVGFDFNEALTRNRRSWNFDERKQDNTLRLDMMMGLSASWILPLYSKNEERFYNY